MRCPRVSPPFAVAFLAMTRDNHRIVKSRRDALAAVCLPVLDDLDAVVTATLSRIRNEMPDYDRVPFEDHRTAVHEQHRIRTTFILEERPPNASDLREASELAQSRARQGISIETLISAFHIGDRELWRRIAASAGEEHAGLLPDVATQMMESLHTLTTVLTASHSEVTRSIQGHKITLTQRFIDLLVDGTVQTEAARIADALAINADGTFQALVWAPNSGYGDVPFELHRALERVSHRLLYSTRGNDLVLLSLTEPSQHLISFAEQHLAHGRFGLGLAREGLIGAAESIEDAFLALGTTHPHRTVAHFDASWIQAGVLSQRSRIEPLVATAVAAAAEHPHLAITVKAFACNNMSIAATSSELKIHPNTVTYRLERWASLVGWNPRSFDGLSKSVAACLLWEMRTLPTDD